MKAIKMFRISIICSALLLVNFSVLQGQTKSTVSASGYTEASYSGLTDNAFMKNWWIIGPVKIKGIGTNPEDKKQKETFDKDELTSIIVKPKKELAPVKIGDTTFTWKLLKNEDGTIDFIKLFGQRNFAVAYALAEIKMEAPAKILVGIGSDDGIKLFLNGALVHANWIGRATTPDDDIVILDLKKGSNQVLVKIQNMEYGWSFAMRKLGQESMTKLLIASSGKGNLDNVKLLIENGADINAKDDQGLTAYQNALIRGREKVLDYLKEKGAKTDIPMPSFDKLVDQIFKSAHAGTTSGVSVLVSQDGKIIYEKGFGYADVGNKVPVSPDTKFRIGSITKQFIATCILKLQEQGKLSIQDKLSKYIPGFPRGDEVTICHLLTHTSGIHAYTNRPDFLKYLTMPITSAALVDTIKAYPYDFNPGDKYQYNNSGFFLLGYILEKLSGKSLAVYLNETLFKPLGMNNTGIYETTRLLDNEAYGYSYSNDTIFKAVNWDMSWAGGAGALYSTAKDLYTWNEAVFNGKVLSDESLKAAFTKTELNNKEKIDYGFGWSLGELRGNKLISHGGGLHGFLSDLERQPEKKVTIVVLCNSTPPPAGINPTQNSLLIAEYLLWSGMEKQSSFASDIKIDENILKSYTGRYSYGRGAVLIVTLEGSQLMAQMTGQSNFPIYPSSNDEFNWKVVEAKIRFVKDDKGIVTHAIHNQGGQQLEVKKMTDEMPVTIATSVYNKYVGKYDMGNNSLFVVSKEGDRLLLLIPGQPQYPLLPASETEYFMKESSVRVTFKANDAGKTETLILNIDGTEQKGNKVKE
ncbi:MAG: serine hydrolase [Bacteroidales bacterium]|nr:serine hydrolase [Bacteroidales bacterium]